MSTTTFDRSAVLRALDAVAERLIDLVIHAPDLGLRVPATPQWTVAEAWSHVATVIPRYRRGPQQTGEWVAADDLADLNARARDQAEQALRASADVRITQSSVFVELAPAI